MSALDTFPKEWLRHGPTVYLMRARGTDRVKIGVTNSLWNRWNAIQSTCPFDLDVLGLCKGQVQERKKMEQLEAELHNLFSHLRLHREWFLFSEEMLDYFPVRP